jgi:hypothetical protein
MRDSIVSWILPGNEGRTKDHIPEKKHVSKVSLIEADPIVSCVGMVRVMRGRSGDQPLKYPRNRVKDAVAV